MCRHFVALSLQYHTRIRVYKYKENNKTVVVESRVLPSPDIEDSHAVFDSRGGRIPYQGTAVSSKSSSRTVRVQHNTIA